MMTHVSVGALIRAVVDETPTEFTADDIAAAVVERISPDLYVTYLHELIAARVSSEVGYLRRGTEPARKSLSTKQQLIRDEFWPKFLEQKISLPGGYKRLADATVEDLRFLSQMRRSQANDLLARASQFEKLAELMVTTGAKTLGRLDPEVGEKTIAA